MELRYLGLASITASIVFIVFSHYWGRKKGKIWLGKPFRWFVTICCVIVGVSLMASTAITFGPPEDVTWWPAIALSGLGILVARLIIMLIPSSLGILGGLLYAFGFYLYVLGFPPCAAVWAYSTSYVVMYLTPLILSIRKILT